MKTSKKLFTKSYYQKLQEKKYAEPTDRAAEVINQADSDDRLKLKVKTKGKPKVIEASRFTDSKDVEIFEKKPFDSEMLAEEDDDNGYA